ncbi:hypothetical protein [Microbacterium sp.]|uniref:hypothetical protein n=1 Tax=Microbacterium sp. TaxID=51671 RepID=UPI002810EF7D|nr:hypothetical protein [Microbacterium sp.]
MDQNEIDARILAYYGDHFDEDARLSTRSAQRQASQQLSATRENWRSKTARSTPWYCSDRSTIWPLRRTDWRRFEKPVG